MQTIRINGVEIKAPDGANVSVVNNQVYIDGKLSVALGDGSESIVIDAGKSRFDLHCDKDVTVNGDVRGSVHARGNVACGEVDGSVESNGQVHVEGDVGGSVNSGAATVGGDVGGSLNAKGDAQVGGDVGGSVVAKRFK